MAVTTPARAQDREPIPGDEPADHDPRDIIVTAPRGAALVEPETELDEEQIGAYGAFSIRELIDKLAPLINGREERPAVLINGKRVADPGIIEGFPPEALNRLAILPPEAAALYGYPADQRVVNLIVKPHFSSWTLDSRLMSPTAGGRDSEALGVSRMAIDGPAIWNVGVRLSRENRLLRSERTPDAADEDRYKSLLPSARSIDATASISHPIGRLSGSLSLSAGLSRSDGLLGRDGLRVLPDRQESRSFAVSTGISGPIGGFQTSVTTGYMRGWNRTLFGRATPLPDDGSRSMNENFSVTLNSAKILATLPAGPLMANISMAGNRSTSTSSRNDGTRSRLGRNQLSGQVSLAIPIADRGTPLLGKISADVSGGVDMASAERRRWRYSGGINWSPFSALDLRASTDFAQNILPISLLNAPTTETILRIYDYARAETVDIRWITGGVPDLRGGNRRAFSLRATLRPLGDQRLTLTSDYQQNVARGGISSLPQLTAEVERAFSNRIVRDADGRLVSIDGRPIPIDREFSSQLNSGVALFLSKAPKSANEGAPKSGIWDNPQIAMSLNHSWQLRNDFRTAPGLPALDRLGDGGGQSRHSVSLQANIGWRGLGASLTGNWQAAARVRDAANADGPGNYRYPAFAQFNVGFYLEPERAFPSAEKKTWFSRLRIALDVQNLFDSYRRVRLADGTTPAGYRRYEVDPLGRSVQISIQKQF